MNHAEIIKTALSTVSSISGVPLQLARIEPGQVPPFIVFMPTVSAPNNFKGGIANHSISAQVAIVTKDQDQAQGWAEDIEEALSNYCDAVIQGIRSTGRSMITEPEVEAPILVCNFNVLTR
jgi:hypothetical protein